jgi:hypothetical protein
MTLHFQTSTDMFATSLPDNVHKTIIELEIYIFFHYILKQYFWVSNVNKW